MSAVTTIVKEAKRIRRKHPNKYKNKRKPWQDGYMKEATAKYNRGHKPKAKKSAKRRTPRKSKKRSSRSKVGKALSPVTIFDQEGNRIYVAGRKKHKSQPRKRSHSPKRRSSPRRIGAANSGMNALVPVVAVAALAGLAYLIFKKPAAPTTPALAPVTAASLVTTGNQLRDAQTSNIVAIAQAAGVLGSSIANIINILNQSNDDQVSAMQAKLQTMTPEQIQAWWDGD